MSRFPGISILLAALVFVFTGCGHPGKSSLRASKAQAPLQFHVRDVKDRVVQVKKDQTPLQYGFISLKSPFEDRYLQAHCDNGETHASNDSRHNEETWLLVGVDQARHMFALRNACNGKYLSVQEFGCIRANRDDYSVSEEWFFEKASENPADSRYFLRSARTDFPGYLGTNPPDHDDSQCGGEVHYVLHADTGWRVTVEPDSGGSGGLDFGQIVGFATDLATILLGSQ